MAKLKRKLQKTHTEGSSINFHNSNISVKPEVEEKSKAKSNPQEYKMFVIWSTLPPQLIGKTTEELVKMGVHDPIYHDLLTIKTRKDFAEKYGISQRTVTDWGKDLSPLEEDEEFNKFMNRLTKKLVFAFFKEQMKRPTSNGMDTWFELIKNRSRNLNININGEVTHHLPKEKQDEIDKALDDVA